MCGEHDQLCPPARHEFMAEMIAHSKLEIIGDAGHMPTLEQPDLTNEVLREWLAMPYVLQYRPEARPPGLWP